MRGSSSDPDQLRGRFLDPCRSQLPAATLAAGLTFGIAAQSAYAQGADDTSFKVAKIFFETNATACDLGIQIFFDTEGIVRGRIEDQNGRAIYNVAARTGLRAIGGQTEGFLEGVEPQIQELLDALDCERDDEVEVVTFRDIREMFPAGTYVFEATMADGTDLTDEARLAYRIPDGPTLGEPDGADDVDPDDAVIQWQPVATTATSIARLFQLTGSQIKGGSLCAYDFVRENP